MKRFYEGDDATTEWGRRFRSWGNSAGSAYGSRFGTLGSTLGGVLGQGLGAGLSRITGNGDYVVGNSLMAGASSGNVSFGGGAIRVRHREFLQDITGTTAFTIQALEINPGLTGTFPFLSQLAQNFEVYEMQGLVFEYRPTCGMSTSGTSTAQGVVVMVVQYNSTNTLFSNKQAMESYEGAISVVPYTGAVCGVECAPATLPLRRLYIRTGPIPAGQDEKMFDMGDFNLATVGQQSNAGVLGELWVSYDCVLSLPKLYTESLGNQNFVHINSPLASSSVYFPLSAGIISQSNNPLENFSGAKFMQFNTLASPGIYCIRWTMGFAASAVNTVGSISLGAYLTPVNCINGQSQSFYGNASTSSTSFDLVLFVNFTPSFPFSGQSARVNFNLSGFPAGGPFNSDYFCFEMNSAFA